MCAVSGGKLSEDAVVHSADVRRFFTVTVRFLWLTIIVQLCNIECEYTWKVGNGGEIGFTTSIPYTFHRLARLCVA